jgi:hypothetical protein
MGLEMRSDWQIFSSVINEESFNLGTG